MNERLKVQKIKELIDFAGGCDREIIPSLPACYILDSLYLCVDRYGMVCDPDGNRKSGIFYSEIGG